MRLRARAWSLRRQLLLGILLPVLALVGLNAVALYRQALEAADTAYDRTLLASAKSLGESLQVAVAQGAPRVQATVPYSALEAFEADNRSRMYYKVTGFDGEWVSGYRDLPDWHGRIPTQGIYAALVDFYNDRYRDRDVRVAVLLQPVASAEGRGMATVQVAETLELRETLARQILIDTLWREATLLIVIAAVVVSVVHGVLRPVRRLSAELNARDTQDLVPLNTEGAPRELRPLLDATNEVMGRLAALLSHQKRFVRDTAHQLRTPLAVLKTQLQSAQRGDLPPAQALTEIAVTVDGATELANQMLALAKVEQLRRQGDAPLTDLAAAVRVVALDLSALIVQRQLDFAMDTEASVLRAHDWALRELCRNLLHNAIKHSPAGGGLRLSLRHEGQRAVLTVSDDGPGVPASIRDRLFQPLAAGVGSSGSGLGLAICQDIVASLGGRIELINRPVQGLDAVVSLPLVDNSG